MAGHGNDRSKRSNHIKNSIKSEKILNLNYLIF